MQQLRDEVEALKEENRCLKNTLKQHYGSSSSENVDFLNQQHQTGAESPIDLQRELKVSSSTASFLVGSHGACKSGHW